MSTPTTESARQTRASSEREPAGSDLHASNRTRTLLEWLRGGRSFTSADAAEALGVSRRTVNRDLTYLRKCVGLDISYDPERGTYVLADAMSALPFLPSPELAPILLSGQPIAGIPEADRAPHAADGSTAVTLRFSARAIRVYVDRGGHIPESAYNADGSVEARFSCSDLDEFLSYVLSQGHEVEVLAPPGFRQRTIMEIHRMREIYAD